MLYYSKYRVSKLYSYDTHTRWEGEEEEEEEEEGEEEEEEKALRVGRRSSMAFYLESLPIYRFLSNPSFAPLCPSGAEIQLRGHILSLSLSPS